MAKNKPILRGAEIFVRALKDEGVKHLFGYPGGAVLHIYDELFKQDAVQHILVRHEQGATHAADGYARATGKPGCVLVTSGPGVTNAITGIATAYMDSIPLVVFSGQVHTHLIGNDAFQEVDAIGISRPCVKHNFLVKDVRDLASTIKKAFYVASSGRPGPVLVDIPKDVTADSCEYEYPEHVEMRSYRPVVKGHPGQIKRAASLILSATKPMIYSGGGVVLGNASEELTELTRFLGFPITNTLMGLGAYPATDQQFVGMLGMHGTYEANMAMHHCDVLIAIGARFDDRVTGNLEKFCPYARIIHIDVDPSSISKNVPVDIPIVGDVKSVLGDLLVQLKGHKQKPDATALKAWWEQIREWQSIDCHSRIISYGATLQALLLPDRAGQLADVALGYDDLAGYVAKPQFFGATVGRYANRIAGAKFTLDGKTYSLAANNGPNALHGGTKGFDKVVWTIAKVESGRAASVQLTYTSRDGEEGYPGTLRASVTYSLDDAGTLTTSYEATTDKPTIVNLTNHSIFNLAGVTAARSILDHRLTVNADAYTPVTDTLIPTGELRSVAGSPFDFRQSQRVGARIRDASDPQIAIGRGYDHNFVLRGGVTATPKLAARLEDPESGRVVELFTTEPGVQVYTGNFLDGTTVGKSHVVYRQGDGIALEPQKFPDSPNQAAFPSARLDPGQTYRQTSYYRFSVLGQ